VDFIENKIHLITRTSSRQNLDDKRTINEKLKDERRVSKRLSKSGNFEYFNED